jgi:hypothetical protein
LPNPVYRFAKNAIKFENVKCISFDEPSLGIVPDLQPEKELVERVYSKKLGVDVQVHLHEPVFYEKFLGSSIEIIGIESARNIEKIYALDAEEISSAGKKLRIGVARTDIDCIIGQFNEKHGVDAWKNEELAELAIEEFESVKTIAERIRISSEKFGDLIKYIGPDCGMLSFPSQKTAMKLLENLRKARDLWTYLTFFIKCFVTLFIIVDPPGNVPFFIALTERFDESVRQKISKRTTIVAFLILIFTTMIGEQLLDFFHVSINSFRVAGGILLFVISVDILLGRIGRERYGKKGAENSGYRFGCNFSIGFAPLHRAWSDNGRNSPFF